MSVSADLTYQQGLNRMWLREDRFDFYWPSLAHLGEQEVYQGEIYTTDLADDNNIIFGYQERYAEYRYRPSQITGKFRSNAAQPLDAWHLAQNFANAPTLSSQFIEDNPPIIELSLYRLNLNLYLMCLTGVLLLALCLYSAYRVTSTGSNMTDESSTNSAQASDSGSAMFGMGTSLGNKIFGKKEASKSRAHSTREARRNRDFQERMYKNRFQYSMDDMKSAGLNPMLAAGMGLGGGSSPSGSMANSAMASDSTDAASSSAQLSQASTARTLARENINLIRANINKTNTETSGLAADNVEKQAWADAINNFDAVALAKKLGIGAAGIGVLSALLGKGKSLKSNSAKSVTPKPNKKKYNKDQTRKTPEIGKGTRTNPKKGKLNAKPGEFYIDIYGKKQRKLNQVPYV